MSAQPTAALAAHRFGLGEPDLAVVGNDPLAWLQRQVGPADVQGSSLPNAEQALHTQVTSRRARQAAQAASAPAGTRDELRELVQADLRARLTTAAVTQRPFAERLAMFWSNHFTVSVLKGSTTGLVGAFEREAIRPHIAGKFGDMLKASTTHPAMLRYLDNYLSAGPNSRVVQRLAQRREGGDMAAPRLSGLNENLAREVLELHTLGAAHAAGNHGPWGGYTQADVTALAAVLTGWRGPAEQGIRPSFDPFWHEPGAKQLLGKRYREGAGALDEVLADLTQHPSTARFIATKLAR
ncbi:MAG: DUF1800 family protein, partial [Burkholderiales bacterium]|nr:DUF1800 family protein [Burkholderiales bacterium]